MTRKELGDFIMAIGSFIAEWDGTQPLSNNNHTDTVKELEPSPYKEFDNTPIEPQSELPQVVNTPLTSVPGIPAHIQKELEDNKRRIAELQSQLNNNNNTGLDLGFTQIKC
jgi:hypothetical protein